MAIGRGEVWKSDSGKENTRMSLTKRNLDLGPGKEVSRLAEQPTSKENGDGSGGYHGPTTKTGLTESHRPGLSGPTRKGAWEKLSSTSDTQLQGRGAAQGIRSSDYRGNPSGGSGLIEAKMTGARKSRGSLPVYGNGHARHGRVFTHAFTGERRCGRPSGRCDAGPAPEHSGSIRLLLNGLSTACNTIAYAPEARGTPTAISSIPHQLAISAKPWVVDGGIAKQGRNPERRISRDLRATKKRSSSATSYITIQGQAIGFDRPNEPEQAGGQFWSCWDEQRQSTAGRATSYERNVTGRTSI